MNSTNLHRAPRIPRPRRHPVTTRVQLLRRYRRPLAVALTVLAVASLLSALAPASGDEQALVMLAADRPAGHVLQATDLQQITVSGGLQDPGLVLEPQLAVGQSLAIGVPAGAVLSEHMFVGPQLLTGAAAGTVAVPIRLSDPGTVGLLHPGQLVDIVLSTGDGFEREVLSETIGQALPVLWVPGTGSDSDFGMLAPTAGGQEGIIVVAAPSELADALSGAVTRGKVSAVFVNGRS